MNIGLLDELLLADHVRRNLSQSDIATNHILALAKDLRRLVNRVVAGEFGFHYHTHIVKRIGKL